MQVLAFVFPLCLCHFMPFAFTLCLCAFLILCLAFTLCLCAFVPFFYSVPLCLCAFLLLCAFLILYLHTFFFQFFISQPILNHAKDKTQSINRVTEKTDEF